MPFTFKEAWRELFQGSACDELDLFFFFHWKRVTQKSFSPEGTF